MVPFKSRDMVSYSHSIATVALSRIASEIKRLVENRDFFMSFLHSTVRRPRYWFPVILP